MQFATVVISLIFAAAWASNSQQSSEETLPSHDLVELSSEDDSVKLYCGSEEDCYMASSSGSDLNTFSSSTRSSEDNELEESFTETSSSDEADLAPYFVSRIFPDVANGRKIFALALGTITSIVLISGLLDIIVKLNILCPKSDSFDRAKDCAGLLVDELRAFSWGIVTANLVTDIQILANTIFLPFFRRIRSTRSLGEWGLTVGAGIIFLSKVLVLITMIMSLPEDVTGRYGISSKALETRLMTGSITVSVLQTVFLAIGFAAAALIKS